MCVCLSVCCLSYPGRKAHAPYYIVICDPVRHYYILPHYLINGTIVGENVSYSTCVFRFSLQLLSEKFLILRRIQRDIVIDVPKCSCQVGLFAILLRF